MTVVPVDDPRRAELITSLGTLQNRITAACTASGRDPGAITLVAVTKTYPAGDVATLARLGVADIGESRDQEAAAKAVEVAELLSVAGSAERYIRVRWHFVGRLQSRKSRSVVSYADAVHSLDRLELVDTLARAVARAQREVLDVFLQVSLDGDPARGGIAADAVNQLADAVAAHQELRLRGVMAVAPFGVDPAPAFARLATVAELLQAAHPSARAISAGMSGDLEAAIENGATHVRVGSALLGRRGHAFS